MGRLVLATLAGCLALGACREEEKTHVDQGTAQVQEDVQDSQPDPIPPQDPDADLLQYLDHKVRWWPREGELGFQFNGQLLQRASKFQSMDNLKTFARKQELEEADALNRAELLLELGLLKVTHVTDKGKAERLRKRDSVLMGKTSKAAWNTLSKNVKAFREYEAAWYYPGSWDEKERLGQLALVSLEYYYLALFFEFKENERLQTLALRQHLRTLGVNPPPVTFDSHMLINMQRERFLGFIEVAERLAQTYQSLDWHNGSMLVHHPWIERAEKMVTRLKGFSRFSH